MRISLLSVWSRMEKPRRRPLAASSCLRMRRPRLWKVETISPRVEPRSVRLCTRSFISRAALLVKVTAAMRPEGTPFSAINQAILRVITLVLPEPAPASTSRGPSV